MIYILIFLIGLFLDRWYDYSETGSWYAVGSYTPCMYFQFLSICAISFTYLIFTQNSGEVNLEYEQDVMVVTDAFRGKNADSGLKITLSGEEINTYEETLIETNYIDKTEKQTLEKYLTEPSLMDKVLFFKFEPSVSYVLNRYKQ